MSEKLEKLKSLWSESLQSEGGLDKAGQKELDALMQDAELVESFSRDQETRANEELLPEVDWKKVDAAVAHRHHRQSIPWGKALLVVAAALGTGWVGTHWLILRDWNPPHQVLSAPAWMGVDPAAGANEKPFKPAASAQPVHNFSNILPAHASRVGPPPKHADLLVSQGPKGIEIDLSLARDSRASLVVATPDGRVIKSLHQGPLPAGVWRFVWEGLDSQGRSPGPGKYRVKASAAGMALSSQVEIYQAP
jgi:hypothetical protein